MLLNMSSDEIPPTTREPPMSHIRKRITALGVTLTMLSFLAGENRADETKPQRPNIVLIMADDLGFSDLGCYGGEIETPHLDRLASEGMRFTQFYNCAVCRLTRASMMTGLHPRRVKGRLLNDNMTTLAEVAQSAGYRTSLTGKWHFPVTKAMDKNRLPTRRGFDEYYGLAAGCCNYFNPAKPFPDNYSGQGPEPFLDQETPVTEFPLDYYTTDAFTAHAVQQIEKFAAADDKAPFFLNLCYTAPHYPLHAKPEDIAKYKGRYDDGYCAMRKERHRRLVELGLFDPKWKLSGPHPSDNKSRYDFPIPPWEQIGELPREKRRMEVYAAMVDSMDQGIGRVLDAIERSGVANNTLVMFLSDNGGCAGYTANEDKELPDSIDTFDYVAQNWGWAQNAPFRRYKTWTHEGGISTPLIVRWPGVTQSGSLTHQVGHVVDFMPTLLDVAGAAYPEKRTGVAVLPTDRLSLLPVLSGKDRVSHKSLCWYLYGNRAVRQGKWKLVWGANAKRWELFDLELDRAETNDLATKYPARVQQMEADWLRWARRTGAPLKGTGI
jgi:arylsulfatase A-like enzyme